MLKEMVDQEAQFIIATHSPILMAFPGARIQALTIIPSWKRITTTSNTYR